MSPMSRGIAQHDSPLDCLHRLFDALALAGVSAWALSFSFAEGFASHEWLVVAAAVVLVFHTIAEVNGLYRSWRGTRIRRELACLLTAWAYTVPIVLGLGLVTTYNAQISYSTKLVWIVASPLSLVVLRLAIRKLQQWLRRRGFNTRRVAIVGVNDLSLQLAQNLGRSPELGFDLTGFYDDRPADRRPEISSGLAPMKGDLDQLVADARSGKVEMVYITFPMRAEERIRTVLRQLGDTTASVYIVPDFFVFELLHARWTSINGLPAVSVFENPLYGVDGLAKRAADLVFGTLFTLLAAVPMLLIAIAVKLSSRGPVFFRQKRYGLDGREILVWKFRSMKCCDNGSTVTQATKDDVRITAIGKILRKSSLDELPQLFNVLAGSMSLVGPRPHASAHNEQYRTLIDGYMLRHKVKPGITGLAQVMGFRGETETLDKMEGRVRYDHKYIREWSLWMDLVILFRTFRVVLGQKGAY